MSKKSNSFDWRIDDPRRLGEYGTTVDPTEAAEIKRLEVNCAPVTDQSHELVIAEQPPNLSDIRVRKRGGVG